MILGIVTAVAFVMTSLKFVTARLGNKKVDHFALIIHKYAAGILVIGTVAHLINVWKLREQRPISMIIIGIIMALAVLATVLSHIFSKKLGKKWIIIHRIAATVVLIGLIFHVALGVTSLTAYKKTIAQLKDEPKINLSKVSNGIYYGECNAGYVEAYVRVTVKNKKITDVTILRHRTERGKAAEVLAGRIVEEQNTNPDAISGATCSSKVIKEAVYQALKKTENK